jgi:hypothetical protein
MLLNEFLKEHKKVEKLEATLVDLVATVKQQATELRKVTAQVQMNNSAGQVVISSH